MKSLAFAFLCFSVTTALAQSPFDKPFEPSLNNDVPTIMTQYDKTTGEVMGTTTVIDGKAYLRDKNGTHYATLAIDKDGTRHMTNPQGQPIEPADIKRILEAVK
jgi:hypothetical protein